MYFVCLLQPQASSIMITAQNSILGCAAITTALVAGLLYAYSCSVTPGLERLPNATYLAAMQSINRAILNPVFFAGFMGAALLLPLSTYSHYAQPVSQRFWLLLGASAVYLIGVMGVTLAGNVPLNEALDAVDLRSASTADMAAHRAAFEIPWNRFHAVRTGASILALVLVITALLSRADD
jgi:uncharacterized membrane protein